MITSQRPVGFKGDAMWGDNCDVDYDVDDDNDNGDEDGNDDDDDVDECHNDDDGEGNITNVMMLMSTLK